MKHSIIFLTSLLVASASIVSADPNITTDTTNKDSSVISIKNKARIAKWATTAVCATVPLFLINRYKLNFNYDLANPVSSNYPVVTKKTRERNQQSLANINRYISHIGVGTSITISSALLDEKATSPLTSVTAGAALIVFSAITQTNQLPSCQSLIYYSIPHFAGGFLGTAATELGNYAERKVVNYYTPERNTAPEVTTN